jgi:hypothetical protein
MEKLIRVINYDRPNLFRKYLKFIGKDIDYVNEELELYVNNPEFKRTLWFAFPRKKLSKISKEEWDGYTHVTIPVFLYKGNKFMVKVLRASPYVDTNFVSEDEKDKALYIREKVFIKHFGNNAYKHIKR